DSLPAITYANNRCADPHSVIPDSHWNGGEYAYRQGRLFHRQPAMHPLLYHHSSWPNRCISADSHKEDWPECESVSEYLRARARVTSANVWRRFLFYRPFLPILRRF